jgi:hypothetical protein
MTNNTTAGIVVKKINIKASTSAAGGTPGATLQDHFDYVGTFVCNGATPVTVTEPNVTAGSAIVITLKTVGGTVSPSVPYIATITPGTGFTVTGTASDTSTYNYRVIG